MSALTTFAGTLGGMLLLAKGLDALANRIAAKNGVTGGVREDPNDVGYYLDGPQGTGPAVALRSLPSDDLPTCPDYIPEWMMPDDSLH